MDLLYKYIITIFRGITWNNHPLTNYFRVPKEWGPKGFDPLGARHFLHGTFAILLMPCLGFSAKDWENYGEFIGTDWFKSISIPQFFSIQSAGKSILILSKLVFFPFFLAFHQRFLPKIPPCFVDFTGGPGGTCALALEQGLRRVRTRPKNSGALDAMSHSRYGG